MTGIFKFFKHPCPIPGTDRKGWKADGFRNWHLYVPRIGLTTTQSLRLALNGIDDLFAYHMPDTRYDLHASPRWTDPRKIAAGISTCYPYISVYFEDLEAQIELRLKDTLIWRESYRQ